MERDKLGRFVKGSIPWIRGRKHSPTSKRKMSENREDSAGHPNYNTELKGCFEKGHKLTNNSLNKMKKNISKKWKDPCSKYNSEEYLKKRSERMKGKNNPMYGKSMELAPGWLGGKSFEPYGLEFNRKSKKFIRERDGGCMLCKIGFEDLKLLKRRVHIHHINYDKQNNLPQNLISLCNPCHGLTNQNRESWTKFFQSLLNEMYKYKYSETGEIILNVNAGDY